MNIIKSFFVAITFLMSLNFLQAANFDSFWNQDSDKAIEKAKAENKVLLILFTGSEWCGWCVKLKKEVLDNSKFESLARKKLVCIVIDTQMGNDSKISYVNKKFTEKYKELDEKYGVRGYPTTVLIAPNGKTKKFSGFKPLKDYMAEIEALVATTEAEASKAK